MIGGLKRNNQHWKPEDIYRRRFVHTFGLALFILVGFGPPASFGESFKARSDFDVLEAANRKYMRLPVKDSSISLLEQLVTEEWRLDTKDQSFISCAEVADVYGICEDDFRLRNSVAILSDVEMYRYYFQRTKIPEHVWSHHLTRMREVARAIYEDRYPEWVIKSIGTEGAGADMSNRRQVADMAWLGTASGVIKKQLIEDLEHYARKESLPYEFTFGRGGCGGGDGTLLTFNIIPPTGTAWILQEFRALKCEISNIDVYDRRACKGWELVQNRVMSNRTGRFRVYARWDDGRIFKEPILVDPERQASFDIKPAPLGEKQ